MSSNNPSSTQTRFLRRGISKIYWLKTINDPKWPTRTEISQPNRFDLTHAVSDMSGWALANEPIETPDMGSTFNSSIPGADKADKSDLTFYEDQHSDAIEQHLNKGAKGWIVLLRKGDIPGSRSMDVFPVQVASRAATYATGNEAAKFKVEFTITDEPSLDVVVPEAFHTLPKPNKDRDDDGETVDVTVVSATAATVHEHIED
ncbi:hypothetical protein [Streptomyces sp. 769]|uniref:phage tail tube protein n=1 Tax=Streptomyces sp. 769 TaxID=1262452 RepID=UPI00057FB679|nr:hypothetical protein [Streptomyces sp. 769]AJC58594.1 hypothetical protein GZL_06021 [Streptomyces sp. 769]